MKKRMIMIAVAGTLLLSACAQLADLGIGTGAVEQDLQIQELAPEPTEQVVSETTYTRYEFDTDINNDWGMRVISGLEKQLIWDQKSNRLRLQTLPPNDLNIAFFNKKLKYDDVIVQAEVENLNELDDAFSLMCRVNEDGWYEFRISPMGYYDILRFDQYKIDQGENAYTSLLEKRINTGLIQGGQAKNTFSLSCVGDVITGFINGEQPIWQKRPVSFEDKTFSEGSIGFGILGYGDNFEMVYYSVETLKP